jgi:hypothetical protein
MLQFLESPIIVWLIIMSFFLFFFVPYLTILPKTNEKHQINTDTSTKVAIENRSECTMLGFLEKLPKGNPIPKECLNCRKLVECAMAKRAFDWYLGKNSAQNSENGRNNRPEMPKHIQKWKKGQG